MSMRKKEVFTICAPIPSFVPRQSALDFLHNHSEFITLNPMVTGHRSVKPPRDAPADELYSAWYEISERVQYVPGFGKIGSGGIKFNGVFHDTPWGLQTHIYAPMSVDMRAQYRIAGNQAGVEPKPARELGLSEIGAPEDGLYLRADIEFTSNMMLASFIKSQTKSAIKEMVDGIVKKAELMDPSVLQSMIDNPKSLASPPPQQEAPLFSPPLNQTVMQQTVSFEQTPPMEAKLSANNTYFTELPSTYKETFVPEHLYMQTHAFMGEPLDMQAQAFIAELPVTPQRSFAAELPSYQAPMVAELYSDRTSSPTSMHSPPGSRSHASSVSQPSTTQASNTQVHSIEKIRKHANSPAQHSHHPVASHKHPNAHRKSTPKPKTSIHSLDEPQHTGRRQSAQQH